MSSFAPIPIFFRRLCMKRAMIVGAVFVTLLVGAVFVVVRRGQREWREWTEMRDGLKTEDEMPPALGRHIEKLREAIPGLGGESEGPGGGDVEKSMAMAYPDSDIPLERLNAARAAADSLRRKGFPTGKGRPGSWVSVGPSEALYPLSIFRTSFNYVPNAYVAGGRATAIAIDPNCAQGRCRLWVYSAGGGLWRTKNALDGEPNWQFLSGTFGVQAGSSIAIDPNDPTGNTLYVGTGEANSSVDSAAGVGLYKSTDGGDTWSGPLGASVFNARAIGTIVVQPGDPNTVYAGTGQAITGVASVVGGGLCIPGAPPWGLYKSTDGGATWTFLHNGSPLASQCDTVAEAMAANSPCSFLGVRRVALDPINPQIVYAGSYTRGVWRSPDGGASWTQIKPTLSTNPAGLDPMRPELAVTALPNGKTRMYIYEGSEGSPTARLFRSDDVATGAPVFTNLSSASVANPGYGTFNLCTSQCWYDSFVYTPTGYPDIVYVGGSYSYGQRFSNKRGLVLSTDAGVSATDLTMDATDIYHPNGLHPDQHAIVTNPNNPYQFFETNDGGVMRSSGDFANVSFWCDDPNRGPLVEPNLSRCRQLLSRVPTKLESLNKGLPTLQFQSLSVSPFNVNVLQGGTQDNGTWQSTGNPVKWENKISGDGGQSGFDAANPDFRFHTYFNASPEVNFSKGDTADWNWIADQIFFGGEPQRFYVPIISDPVVSKSMFVGLGHVWRTKTWGMGGLSTADFRTRCNTWNGVFDNFCGDWLPLGAPAYVPLAFPFLPNPNTYSATRLTGTLYGMDRTGGSVAAVERATSNTSTLWAATGTGRVFISRNVDAEPASA